MNRDHAVRLAAFDFLGEQVAIQGEVLPWTLLSAGFQFEGERVPIVGQKGIFKPRVMELPLSVTTAPQVAGQDRPYDDYRARPVPRPVASLRRGRRAGLPYVPNFDRRARRPCESPVVRRRIRVRRRSATLPHSRHTAPIHQEEFRVRVLRAYRESCAVCRLRHGELLDAAHILSDKHPKALPIVPNGLALCKLHHAAFDRHILGVRPDLIIEIREDILREVDGPMLVRPPGVPGATASRSPFTSAPTRP